MLCAIPPLKRPSGLRPNTVECRALLQRRGALAETLKRLEEFLECLMSLAKISRDTASGSAHRILLFRERSTIRWRSVASCRVLRTQTRNSPTRAMAPPEGGNSVV